MLLEFADLHGLVDGQGGVADRGAIGCGRMAGGDGEIAAGALDSVGIAVTLRALHGDRIRRDQFIQGRAMIVQGGEAALSLGNLQQVTANAGQANRLGRGGARVGGRHLLQGVLINTEGDSHKDEHRG